VGVGAGAPCHLQAEVVSVELGLKISLVQIPFPKKLKRNQFADFVKNPYFLFICCKKVGMETQAS